MAESAAIEGWTALFLPSRSPGQIVRFLQRRHRTLATPVPALLLSDAAGPNRLRALTFEAATPDARAYLEATAPDLVTAFSLPVTLLQVVAGPEPRWSAITWNIDGAEPECADGDNAAPPAAGLLARLRGQPSAPPVLAWAHSHQLPIDRLPPLRPAGALSVVDYETVAALDRKDLLVENSPRLYRFPLG